MSDAAASAPKKRRGRPPDPEGQALVRRQLLLSTGRTVGEFGFQGTTVARITAGAKVATGTFYIHFASVDEAFEELVDFVRTEMIAFVGQRVRGASSFLDVEELGFRAFFDYLRDYPWMLTVQSQAAVWVPQAYERYVTNIHHRYTRSLQRSKRRGELEGYSLRDLEVIAMVLLGARKYIAQRFCLSDGDVTPLSDELVGDYMRFVSHGLSQAVAEG